ncbi:TPA: SH3 domain-containing protein [Streptococcus suis]|nr:SH3 domain-containing protein [Streptococcus suis]
MRRYKFGKEKQNFSIRKYSMGAASVLIGTSLVFGLQEVKADEQAGTVAPSSLPLLQVEESSQADKTSALSNQVAVETKEVATQENKVESEQVSEVPTSQTGEALTLKSQPSSEKESSEQALTPASQEVPVQLSSVQEASKNLVTAVNKSESDLAPQGKYIYENELAVKNQPTQSAPVVFYAQPGDKVNYDKKLESDGHQWISYVSFSGTRRYVDLGQSASSPATAPSQPAPSSTSVTSQSNPSPQAETLSSRGSYHFSKQVSVKNEAKVAAATQFTFEKGDKVKYDKTLVADGHQWISYLSYSGTRRYVDLGKVTSLTPSAPTVPTTPQTSQPTGQLRIQNQTSSGFDIEVTNVSDSKGIKAVKVPVWAEQNGQNDIVWYDAAKQANGNYKVSVSLANHKNEQGTYQAHLYYVENDGKLVGVAATQVKVESKQASTTPQSETLASNGTYTFTQQVSVKNEAKAAAATQFTFEKGEKVNYDKKLESDGHQWISYVSHSGTRRYVDLGKVTSSAPSAPTPTTRPQTSQPTGQLTIQNQTSSGFDIEVTNVSDSKGIKAVKVPVWSDQNGQNDIVWYDAAKQANGNYKVSVSLANHNNEQGTYQAHLYYVENDGKLVGVAATQVKVESKQVSTTPQSESLASQGTYTFSKQVSVKNEAKANAPTQFTFEKGDKVNYDKKLESDGHQWISYVSHSGTRRYVDLGKVTSSAPSAPTSTTTPQTSQPTGQLTIQNQTSSGFDIEVTNVSDSKGIKAVKVPVWADQNGQNDIVWYDAAKQADGNYKVSVSLANHKNEQGTYQAHLYYVENDGKLVGVAATQIKVESKQASTTPQSESLASQGTYTFSKQVSVKNEAKANAPTQFTFEKGDKVNYDKKLESDGHQWISYVSFSGTRRYVDLGKVTSSTPSAPTAPQSESLASQGTYTFTKQVSVKNEAKAAAATQFTFEKGEKINYDKVVEADGYRWLSYTSFSGTQRFVQLID